MASMDLTNEVVRLRAELESVTAQRDLLLCQVSGLRRELEMNELKHIQDESFTHKVDDEEGAGAVVLNPPEGFYSPHHGLHHHHMHSSQLQHGGSGAGSDEQDRGYMEGNRYVAQQHRSITGLNHSNSSCSSNSNTSSNMVTVGGSMVGASSGNGNAQADSGGGPPLYITAPPDGFNMHTNGRRGTDVAMRPNEQKDSSIPQKRGKMIRGRYEMSQDLLDKQVEILERRYGGLRARRAATTIQRAFRRRQLLKKFSAITAMAKAADSNSRRQHADGQSNDVYGNSLLQKSPVSLSDKLSITRPIRSMSLRERHDIDISMMSHSAQNDIELMAARVQQSANQLNMIGASLKDNSQQVLTGSNRSDGDSGVCSCSVSGSVTNISTSSQNDSLLHHHMHLNHSGSNMSSPNPSMMMWNSSGEMIHNSSVNSLSGGSVIDKGPIYGNMLSSGGKPLNSPSLRQQQQLAALQAQQALARKVPPDVPKRTSSITLSSDSPSSLRRADCCGTPVQSGSGGQLNALGSMSSVQSSGSDSSSVDHHHHQRTASGSGVYAEANGERYAVWKRQNATTQPPYYPADGSQLVQPQPLVPCCAVPVSQSAVQILRDDSSVHRTDGRNSIAHSHTIGDINVNALKVSETVRKRQYRVGLNLFNKKPERGIAYLISRGFLENSPRGVARFLITRKGLSKQMIGEYLGNLQNSFNMAVLECFVSELELSGMQVDVALRRYQAHFRLPGEAQKIERLVEAFARRYCTCNLDVVQRLRTHDTIFVLAFAIIMLNTDLHTPNLKPEARMSLDDFIKNLRGIDDCGDIDREMLTGIYDRVKGQEFRPGSDHVTQVLKVQATIVGKKPHLALPHRRLVCYCRLYEIPDIHKKERPGVHQREVFLFNDLLVITKIFSKKKSSVTYTFRQSFPLCGMIVTLFSVPHYPFGIRLSRRVDGRRLATFNARNEHDRCKFAEDLRESIAEMDDMDTMRIEGELSRNSKATRPGPVASRTNVVENRDSGVADVDIDHQQCADHLHAIPGPGDQHPPPPNVAAPSIPVHHHHHYHVASHAHAHAHPCLQHLHHTHPPPTTVIKRNVLSNSLVDINDPMAVAQDRLQRRGSVGSLDSGMSVSFHHSPSTKTIHQPVAGMNQNNSPNLCAKTVPFGHNPHAFAGQRSPQGNTRQFLGGVFQGRQRKMSASGIPDPSPGSKAALGKSTEVIAPNDRSLRRTRITNL